MTHTLNQIQSYALSKESHRKQVVYVGLCTLALLVSMYVYFVGKIVFDVVARRGAESSIRIAQSKVSSLEALYYKELQELHVPDRVASLGLYESRDTLYTSRLAGTPKTVGMANEF